MEAFCAIAFVVWLIISLVVHQASKGKLNLFNRHSSGASSIIGLQEIVEPNVKHVIQVKEQKHRGEEIGSPPDAPDNTNPS